jgi:undecaprenyl pyrophosphate phosphatase UppP
MSEGEWTILAIVIAIVVLYGIINVIVMFRGFDFKKWVSWLYVALGFLCGFTIGLLLLDVKKALLVGLLCAFLLFCNGVMLPWQRKLIEKWQRRLFEKKE